MDRQDKAQGPKVSRPPAKFEFVTGNDSQTQVRQHVAKLNWRRRKEQRQAPPKVVPSRPRSIAAYPVQPYGPHPPQLQLPVTQREGDLDGDHEDGNVTWLDSEIPAQPTSGPEAEVNDVYMDLRHTLILVSPTRKWKLVTAPTASESLISPYHPLNSMDLDPFNTIKPLSRSDQRLLHHWVNEYAYKAFGRPTDPAFNPLGNVYVPIDFSHTASVHGILAHAASHIAYLRGERTSVEALTHKMTAIHLVNQALESEETSVSDENISAVLRLLTYERYWGTEEVWQFHRRGLNQMIKRRGGLSTLSDNWQLETRVHLVALMQTPRWRSVAFSSPSSPPDFAFIDSPQSDDAFGDTEQPHSDFTNFFSDIRSVSPDVALKYPAINRATEFLHSLARSSNTSFMAQPESVGPQEIARLMCLFYIATIVKGANRSHFNLLWLNDSLARTEQAWNNSVEILRWLLLQGVGRGRGGIEDMERTERLKEIALLLNKSTYRSIEDHLLNVLVVGPADDPLLPCE